MIRSDYSMNDNAKKQDPDACAVKPCNVEETESYYVEATGASVTTDSNVKLPSDKYDCLPINLVTYNFTEVAKWTC